MYYFSALALTLNEMEEGVAPTDSRRRPDQRLMEAGRWEEANAEKQRIEEKQRGQRREREREAARAANPPDEGKGGAGAVIQGKGEGVEVHTAAKSTWNIPEIPHNGNKILITFIVLGGG